MTEQSWDGMIRKAREYGIGKYLPHPLCDQCWNWWAESHPLAPPEPYRMENPQAEKCARCGADTRSGIYVRATIEELRGRVR